MLKEIKLPSGAVLKIQAAPFADAKALYQALLEEIKGVNIGGDKEAIGNSLKNFACISFSSKKIEAAIEVCLKRCLYEDLKIDKNTFEPVERREDYPLVCMSVIEENCAPFMKSLFAELSRYLAILDQKSPA